MPEESYGSEAFETVTSFLLIGLLLSVPPHRVRMECSFGIAPQWFNNGDLYEEYDSAYEK